MNDDKLNIPEVMQKYIRSHLRKSELILFLFSLASALAVHFFMFVNKLPNHDDITALYTDYSFAVSSGRWMLRPLGLLMGGFSSSWVIGVAGAVFTAIGALYIIKTLRIDSFIARALAAVILVSFPSVCATYTYMFCASPYLLALALSAVGAYMITKNKLRYSIVGTLLLTVSLGTYQSYIALAATLLLVNLTVSVYDGTKFRDLAKTALGYIICLVSALVLYFIITKTVLAASGEQITDYQGMSSFGELTLGTLITRIKLCYKNFTLFHRGGIILTTTKLYRVLMLAVLIFILAATVFAIVIKKLWKKPLMLISLAIFYLLFPLASTAAYLMTDEATVHLLMLYSLVIYSILPCIVLDRLNVKVSAPLIIKAAAVTLAIVISLSQSMVAREYILQTNKAYFSMDITYENLYSYCVRLASRVEQTDGYYEGIPVYFYGDATLPQNSLPASSVTGAVTGEELFNSYARVHFMVEFAGFTPGYVTPEFEEYILTSDVLETMPCYPDVGSVVNFEGNAIIVKLSD